MFALLKLRTLATTSPKSAQRFSAWTLLPGRNGCINQYRAIRLKTLLNCPAHLDASNVPSQGEFYATACMAASLERVGGQIGRAILPAEFGARRNPRLSLNPAANQKQNGRPWLSGRQGHRGCRRGLRFAASTRVCWSTSRQPWGMAACRRQKREHAVPSVNAFTPGREVQPTWNRPRGIVQKPVQKKPDQVVPSEWSGALAHRHFGKWGFGVPEGGAANPRETAAFPRPPLAGGENAVGSAG